MNLEIKQALHRDLARRSMGGSVVYFILFLIIELTANHYFLNTTRAEIGVGFALLFFGVLRIFSSVIYLNSQNPQAKKRFLISLVYCTIILSLIWAFYLYLKLAHVNTQVMPSSNESMVIIMVTAGIASGALVSLTASRRLLYLNTSILFGSILYHSWHIHSYAFFYPVLIFLLYNIVQIELLTKSTREKITNEILLQKQNLELKKVHHETEVAHQQLIYSSKMSSLGEMAGGVAHEINNPLAIIVGKASRLKRIFSREQWTADEKIKILKDTEDIIDTSERIAKIISGLKTFSRNADKDPFVLTEIKSLVNDSLALCQEKFKHLSVELIVGVIPDLTIECRPTQISQVLINLLNNALDAVTQLPEKWVRLDISEVAPHHVRFTVRDSGLGIPEEVLNKLMQPFFTTKDVGKGTGLGLSISKGIAEAHQGTLRYDSSSKNTSFQFEVAIQPKKSN